MRSLSPRRLAAVLLGAAAGGCLNAELADTGRAGFCPAFEVSVDRQVSARHAWAVAASVGGFSAEADAILSWPSPDSGSVSGDLEVTSARVWVEYATLGDPARNTEYGVALGLWSYTRARYLYRSDEARVCVEQLRSLADMRAGVFFRAVLAPGVRVRFEEALGLDVAESLAALEFRLGAETHLLVGWRAFDVGLADEGIDLDLHVFGGTTVVLSVRF